MGRKGRCRDPEVMEPTWVKAYELRRDGMSLSEIATEMAGDPHYCGSKTTARRWAENGAAVIAAKGDPLRKHHVRRELAIDALDALRVEMRTDVKVAGAKMDLAAYYRLQMEAIERAARIGGYRAPPPTARVEVTGSGAHAGVDPNLFASLASLPREEIDAALAAIRDMLPDGRNQP